MNKLILIVDDEKEIREALCDEFERKGWTVKSANNAGSALAMINLNKFDLVISDVRMPGGDGVHLLNVVKQLQQKPKIVIMTAFADISVEQAKAMGAIDLISKPFSLKSIVARAEEILKSTA